MAGRISSKENLESSGFFWDGNVLGYRLFPDKNLWQQVAEIKNRGGKFQVIIYREPGADGSNIFEKMKQPIQKTMLTYAESVSLVESFVLDGVLACDT